MTWEDFKEEKVLQIRVAAKREIPPNMKQSSFFLFNIFPIFESPSYLSLILSVFLLFPDIEEMELSEELPATAYSSPFDPEILDRFYLLLDILLFFFSPSFSSFFLLFFCSSPDILFLEEREEEVRGIGAPRELFFFRFFFSFSFSFSSLLTEETGPTITNSWNNLFSLEVSKILSLKKSISQ